MDMKECVVCDKAIIDEKNYQIADSILMLNKQMNIHYGKCSKKYDNDRTGYQLKFRNVKNYDEIRIDQNTK